MRARPRNGGLPETQLYGKVATMKTTVDLPDDLLREVKILAAQQHRRLKDVLAEVIGRGLAHGSAGPRRLPRPVKLAGGPLTTEEVEAAIESGRD